MLVAAPLALVLFAIQGTGRWLIVQDPLQRARAAVVIGGNAAFRATEAARLYEQGWTQEVWVTQQGPFFSDDALAELGIERTPEYTYSIMVLERLGVPKMAIRVVPGRNLDTAQEVRSIARALHEVGGSRLILVTSSYHTRRVKILWHKIVGDHPEAIVRYTPDDPFEASRWWRDSADMMNVAREWIGLFNAWLGFPVKSQHW